MNLAIRYPYIDNPLGFKLPEPKIVVHPIITEWDDFTEKDKTILQNIKKTILSYIKNGEVMVFGSRVKGNWNEQSDYDILIVSDVDSETLKKLRNLEYEVKVDLKSTKNTSNFLNGIEIE